MFNRDTTENGEKITLAKMLNMSRLCEIGRNKR